MVHFMIVAPVHSRVTNVFVCNLYIALFGRVYSYVTRMYSYITRVYSYVTRMYSCVVLVTIRIF